MSPAYTIKKFIKNVKINTDPDTNQKVLNELLGELDSSKPSADTYQPVIWSILMSNKVTKFAAAAAIIIAVLFGLNIIGNGGSVALAEVLENIMDISAYSYWMRTSSADTSDYSEFRILSSKDYGQRSDVYVPDKISGEVKLFTSTYIVLSEQVIVSVLPENKQYARINLTDEIREEREKDNASY